MSAADDYGYGSLLDLVANDPRREDDYREFCDVLPLASVNGQVSMNSVRRLLSNEHGLRIEPRRFSSFYRRACKDGRLRWLGEYDVNDDGRGRNAGKPQRLYVLGATA